MDDDRVKQWIEDKLDEGVSEDRIKDILRDKGHDPSIVEDVKSPFDEGSDIEEDVFKEESGEEQEEDIVKNNHFETVDFGFKSLLDKLNLESPTSRFGLLVALMLVLPLTGFGIFYYIDLPSEGVSGECPDVGVGIQSFEVSQDEVSAVVFVSRQEADVELELYNRGELVDSRVEFIGGREEMTVSGTGDELVLSPVGCESIRDSRFL